MLNEVVRKCTYIQMFMDELELMMINNYCDG